MTAPGEPELGCPELTFSPFQAGLDGLHQAGYASHVAGPTQGNCHEERPTPTSPWAVGGRSTLHASSAPNLGASSYGRTLAVDAGSGVFLRPVTSGFSAQQLQWSTFSQGVTQSSNAQIPQPLASVPISAATSVARGGHLRSNSFSIRIPGRGSDGNGGGGGGSLSAAGKSPPGKWPRCDSPPPLIDCAADFDDGPWDRSLFYETLGMQQLPSCAAIAPGLMLPRAAAPASVPISPFATPFAEHRFIKGPVADQLAEHSIAPSSSGTGGSANGGSGTAGATVKTFSAGSEGTGLGRNSLSSLRSSQTGLCGGGGGGQLSWSDTFRTGSFSSGVRALPPGRVEHSRATTALDAGAAWPRPAWPIQGVVPGASAVVSSGGGGGGRVVSSGVPPQWAQPALEQGSAQGSVASGAQAAAEAAMKRLEGDRATRVAAVSAARRHRLRRPELHAPPPEPARPASPANSNARPVRAARSKRPRQWDRSWTDSPQLPPQAPSGKCVRVAARGAPAASAPCTTTTSATFSPVRSTNATESYNAGRSAARSSHTDPPLLHTAAAGTATNGRLAGGAAFAGGAIPALGSTAVAQTPGAPSTPPVTGAATSAFAAWALMPFQD